MLDRQRLHRRCEGGLGEGRRGACGGIYRGEGRAGVSHTGYRGKIQPAHVAYVGVLVRKLPDTSGESFAPSLRIDRTVVLSRAGARGQCVGRDWRGDCVLRDGACLRKSTRTTWLRD